MWFGFFMDEMLTLLKSDFLSSKEIKLYIKRDDLLHPLISGNKFRKLKFTLEKAKNYNGIISFGGAYSNHIYSLAAAGDIYNIPTIGLIRGDEHKELNSTLSFAREKGMKLIYVPREEYRLREDESYLKLLSERYPNWLIIPEGGTNTDGVRGCEEVLKEITVDYNVVCLPVGSGGTISGVINSSSDNVKVLGFPALKKSDYLKDVVLSHLIEERGNWGFIQDYHFGGYAKMKPELLTFVKGFKEEFGVLLDPIYTGKMMFGIFDLIDKDFFEPGTSIIAIHTGGLQGWGGFDPNMLG